MLGRWTANLSEVSPGSIGVCRGIESVDIRGGVEIVVERVEVAESFCLHVRDNRGIDERELLVLPKDSFRRGKPVRRERVDVNPRILFESIEEIDSGGVPSVRRQAVQRLCEHIVDDHRLGEVS